MTTLQGANVGVGGEGTWSTSLTVNVYDVTSGAIEATSPGVNAIAGVSITYSGSGSSSGGATVVYAPGQCTITGAPGGPMYAYPGGPQTSYFVAGGPVEAKQRTVYNGMDWYMIQPEASMGNPRCGCRSAAWRRWVVDVAEVLSPQRHKGTKFFWCLCAPG